MSESLPEIMRWKNYDPDTGVGDPSTPLTATRLNTYSESIEARTQAAVDAANDAVEAAEAAAAQAEDVVTGGLDASYARRDELVELQQETMSIEDGFVSTVLTASNIATTASFVAFVAPYPLIVTGVSLVAYGGATVAASDTNYWSISPRKVPAATGGTGWVNITTRTTRVTGGAAIGYRNPWFFDGEIFASNTLATGEYIDIAFIATGTPGAIGAPVAVTIQYRPV